jgi:CDP-diacylglycerol--glycerol-3-phosphate 3-phosphatidyltransferase
MNIAHFLTILRIIIIPLFPYFYLKYATLGIETRYLPYILLVILTLCESTDLVDGYIARKKGQVTDLGKILDPMADTISHMIVLMTFTQGWVGVPILLVIVFLYREFIIHSLRTVCALNGYALAARKTGKIKSFFQAGVNFVIVLMMIPYTNGNLSLETLQTTSMILIGIAAVYSVATAFDYIFANISFIKKVLIAPNRDK